MRIGSSLVLIALGAILKFAVTASVSGLSLSTVGVVLMLVGLAGVVISLIVATNTRRADVVSRTARVDYVEPTRVGYVEPARVDYVEPQRIDDPRI